MDIIAKTRADFVRETIAIWDKCAVDPNYRMFRFDLAKEALLITYNKDEINEVPGTGHA